MKRLVLFFVCILAFFALSACNQEPTSTEPPATTGHIHTEQVTKTGTPATCEQDGLSDEIYCSVCQELLQTQQVIPATGHAEQIIPGKPATKTETGLTEGKKCSVCDATLLQQEEIPAIAIWLGVPADSFAGGSGTQEDPYQISNGRELAYLGKFSTGHFDSSATVYCKLTEDIDLGTHDWKPIQLSRKVHVALDGDGHVVRNMRIDIHEKHPENVGLFHLVSNATIENLGLADYSIRFYTFSGSRDQHFYYIGGLAGTMTNCTVRNCYASGALQVDMRAYYDRFYCGGLIGKVEGNFTLASCYTDVDINAIEGNLTVDGKTHAGGIVGRITGTAEETITLTDCYSLGNIVSETKAGGIVSEIEAIFTIQNCFSSGNITVQGDRAAWAGVIAGSVGGRVTPSNKPWSVIGCLSLSDITAKSGNGNAVAASFYNYQATVFSDCYRYEGQTLSANGKKNEIIREGTDCSIEDLNDPSFYLQKLKWSEDIWDLSDLDFAAGKYPKLKGVG